MFLGVARCDVLVYMSRLVLPREGTFDAKRGRGEDRATVCSAAEIHRALVNRSRANSE